MMSKKCKRCGVVRDITDFHLTDGCIGGRRPVCKYCIREQQKIRYYKDVDKSRIKAREYNKNNKHITRAINLKKKFNITLEEYDELFYRQHGVCAICGRPETSKYKGTIRHLAIDHNHVTNEIRGLLCQKCNQALGLLNDNPVIIKSMLEYING